MSQQLPFLSQIARRFHKSVVVRSKINCFSNTRQTAKISCDTSFNRRCDKFSPLLYMSVTTRAGESYFDAENKKTLTWFALMSMSMSIGCFLLNKSDSTQCDVGCGTPVVVECDLTSSESELPTYTLSDVAKNNGENGRPVWMTYGGIVYDVTDFIPNHPGGSEKIILAAGGSIEPFWNVYRQHFATDLPLLMMEKMVIGKLDEKEQEEIDDMMEREMENDPYRHEPKRNSLLKVHGDQPMNAEVPGDILTLSYLTPNDLFYIRHHHPVPYITTKDILSFRLDVDLRGLSLPSLSLSLKDLHSLPQTTITATLQCSGNRRGDYNTKQRTSGTAWDQGAISTATWTGPRLSDILSSAGLTPVIAEKLNIKHVRFESLDGMTASIPVKKALDYYGDCILALKMNGDVLPRDHGFPLRVIVPGYAAVRNVKWLKSIELSTEEAEGPWQRGLNYKILPPSVTNAKSVDLKTMPSMMEVSLFSGITKVQVIDNKKESDYKPGDIVFVAASGWAWAGGGRNVARIDITGDRGDTWVTAKITHGGDQEYHRAWAWVFWSCEGIPAVVGGDGTLEVCSKAVDIAANVQPENGDHSWNVRGLGNNSWHKKKVRLSQS